MNFIFLSGHRNFLRDQTADRRWFLVQSDKPKVRIRCSAPDPFNGLRGRAYINARGLTPQVGPMRAIHSADVCRCAQYEQAQLLSAVQAICASHERRTITDRPQPMWNHLGDESLHELLDLPLPAGV